MGFRREWESGHATFVPLSFPCWPGCEGRSKFSTANCLSDARRRRQPNCSVCVSNLAAVIHGEWIRIHPYANGNGRTARLWAAWVAKRYSLPIFVKVKPRPGDTEYAVSSHLSMGRPPDIRGDHEVARVVFAELLAKTIP